jgi:hypothetical protein
MAGTVKLCVPALAPGGELTGGGGATECELCPEAVAEGLAAECLCVEEGIGAGDDGDDPDGADEADEPPEAGPDAAAEGVDPLDAHAVRPAPPMTAAMITAGTRHILMLIPSAE